MKTRSTESFTSSKLAYYFSALEAEELEEFRNWLISPIQASKKGQHLLLYLLQERLKGQMDAVTHTHLGQQLTLDAEKEMPKLAKEYYIATYLLHEYFAWKAYQKDEASKNAYLAEALLTRGKTKYFPSHMPKLLLHPRCTDDKALAANIKLHAAMYDFQLASAGRSQEMTVQPTLDGIDVLYVYQKLKFFCRALNQDKILDTAHAYRLEPEILKLVHEREPDLPPLVNAYLAAYRMLKEPDDSSHFDCLFALFSEGDMPFGIADSKELLAHLLNYCVRKVNTGELIYSKARNSLYNIGLEEGLLFEGSGGLSPETYKNIAFSFIDYGDIVAALSFVERYRDSIVPGRDREAVRLLVDGRTAYLEGAFQNAINCFTEVIVQNHDIFFEVNGRILLCKALLEAQKLELLEFELESFRNFVRRNKLIPAAKRSQHGTFAKLFKKFVLVLGHKPQKILPDLKTLQNSISSGSVRLPTEIR